MHLTKLHFSKAVDKTNYAKTQDGKNVVLLKNIVIYINQQVIKLFFQSFHQIILSFSALGRVVKYGIKSTNIQPPTESKIT